jgi:outer membrane protein assembly factor BamE (lipoprotein component of BamABCDE complex)
MERMISRLMLSSIAAAALLMGCQVTQRHQLAGRDIERQYVTEISPGVTTKQDISDRFGKPDKISNKTDGEEYLYTYRGVVEKTDELGVYAKKQTTDERKTLRVLFRGDVVKEVSYTNSHNPDENISKEG